MILDTISFPECKIATLDELRVVLNFMLNYAGVHFELTSDDTLVLHFYPECLIETVEFPIHIAKVLGLLRRDEIAPLFLKVRYHEQIILSRRDDDGFVDSQGTWFNLLRSEPKELQILLPYRKDTFIWNDVSHNSFQMMVVGLDKMKRMFTGTELTKTLAVVPIQPDQNLLHYKPLFPNYFELTSDDTLKLHFLVTSFVEEIEFPLAIAKVVGLLRKDGVLPLLLRIRYQDEATIFLEYTETSTSSRS